MIKLIFKNLIFISILLIFCKNVISSENRIIFKINSKAYTLYDLEKRIEYLDFVGSNNNIDEYPHLSQDYSLSLLSPCIDAGTADLNGDGYDDIINYFGSAPNMGAIEYLSPCDPSIGDANFDGMIDILDIIQIVDLIMGFMSSYPTYEQICRSDVNQDSRVDVFDIIMLVSIILNQLN